VPSYVQLDHVAAIDIEKRNGLLFIEKGGQRIQAYCIKCRKKREIKNPKAVTMKNKKHATQGVCPVCESKIFRIGKA
jgi:Zn finger protein HypA/HybF involved in hydrogenase expression